MSEKTYPVTKTPVTPNTRQQEKYSARNISKYIWDKFMHLTKRANWGIDYFVKQLGPNKQFQKRKPIKAGGKTLPLEIIEWNTFANNNESVIE